MVPLVISSIAALALVWAVPALFWPALAALAALAALFLADRHTTVFCILWLLITGMSLEMTLSDLVGPEAFQPTIAVIKAVGIGLAAISALRWGVCVDGANPAWCFAALALAGLAHGLYPGLTPADSARSLVGSIAPFAFCFVRVPSYWAQGILRATRWCPIIAVLGGMVLAAASIRPLFIESGGLRLAGLGHPAFLAGVCLPAIYAGLITVYRDGKPGELALLGVNLLVLVLTGARGPLLCAISVIGLSLIFISSPAFSARRRIVLLLAAAALAPLLLVLSDDLASVRLFNLLNTDLGNLSGREMLWPAFEAAASGSPWFGWGIGAGNVIIPPDGPVAHLLHTWAAHNEYLRIEVEGGQIGRAMLVGTFAIWVWRRTIPLPRPERLIMRLVFAAFAGHAFTDNVLISTPACVLFIFTAAVFAGGRESLPDSRHMA
jgi:O-antigen ligase